MINMVETTTSSHWWIQPIKVHFNLTDLNHYNEVEVKLATLQWK